MSVRKPPQLTPELLASARRNAQYSTGPHSEAGRQHSKLNALKHGERAALENHYEVMRALGEDPQRFEKLKQELAASFGPGDALWDQQLEDLAKLYWRRNRIERMRTGLMRRTLEAEPVSPTSAGPSCKSLNERFSIGLAAACLMLRKEA